MVPLDVRHANAWIEICHLMEFENDVSSFSYCSSSSKSRGGGSSGSGSSGGVNATNLANLIVGR